MISFLFSQFTALALAAAPVAVVSSPSPFPLAVPAPQLVAETLKLSKKRTSLSKLDQALLGGKGHEALVAAKTLEKEKRFVDLFKLIKARAQVMEAENELLVGKGAAESATAAQQVYLSIAAEYPGTFLHDEVSEGLAKVDAVFGFLAWKKKKNSESLKSYERVWQRISDKKLHLVFNELHSKAFASVCAKLEPQGGVNAKICRSGWKRLTNLFPKGAIEAKSLRDNWTPSPEPVYPTPNYDRWVKSYKVSDQDDSAMEELQPLLLKGDSPAALEKVNKFLESYPRSDWKSRALYWRTRLLRKMGRDSEAAMHASALIEEFPLSPYSTHAAIENGVEYSLPSTPPFAQARDPWTDPADAELLDRVEWLAGRGGNILAAKLLKQLGVKRYHSAEMHLYLAALCTQVGFDQQAIRHIGELSQRGDKWVRTLFAFQTLYPFRFQDIIEAKSKEWNVDPLLATSLIKQESAFNSEVSSSVGALGLMQLMPFTAVEMNPSIQQRDLLGPDLNISLGTKYLGGLIRRFNGNVVFALAGYNGGPNRVEKWAKESGENWGMIEFIESIPFRETREYVLSILRNYYWYTYLKTGTRLKTFDSFWTGLKLRNGSA